MLGITSQQETSNLRKLLKEITEAAKTMSLYNDREHKQLSRYGKLTRQFTVAESNTVLLIHSRILTLENKNAREEEGKKENRGPRVGQTFFKYPKRV